LEWAASGSPARRRVHHDLLSSTLPIALDRFAIRNKLAIASIADSEGFILAPTSLIEPQPAHRDQRLSGHHFIQYQ
jgi:hypothetical protein